MDALLDALKARLQLQETRQLYRRRRTLDSPQGAEIVADGNRYVSFCSNDYLGLANHPEVVAALISGARQYGVGSGAAHLITGHHRIHQQLEEALARYTGRERALLFSTGYMANLGVITALAGRGDAVFEDRLNHASLLDGGRLSGARFTRYPHNEPSALALLLDKQPAACRLVVTDGVFSMDGSTARLQELADVCSTRQTWLMVDDAHGLGVLGTHGKGTTEHLALSPQHVPILMGTLGKAFGTFGAFIAGADTLIEYLIQFARSYIYTTALSPALAQASLQALQISQDESWRREHLRRLISHFRQRAQALQLPITDSITPIQPYITGDAQSALALSQRLQQSGLLVPAIRPPTVPEGSARLRITLSAAHDLDQVDRLIDQLAAHS